MLRFVITFARWTKQRLTNRPDTELEQILIRLFGGYIWLAFILYIDKSVNIPQNAIYASYLYILIAKLNLVWIFASPSSSTLRRITSMVSDVLIITYIMHYTGKYGSPLFGVYLSSTFAYGLRFGNNYLYTSLVLCLCAFGFLLLNNEYWIQQEILGVGLFILLILLSFYVSKLITNLQKAIDLAQKANEAKTNFLANMSHEIRTPLNGVIAMSSLLSRTEMDSKQKEYSSTINASAKSLLNLINDILDISKIEAGKTIIENINFDLFTLINSIHLMLSPEALKKKLEFNIHISPNIPFLIKGDEQHLRQILINLTSNAIKFTNEGYVDIILTKEEETDNKIKINFNISDTGIGIPEKYSQKIFDKFTQADESITRKFGGTGLGIAISNELVQSMGGEIELKSKVNTGTTFSFSLEFEKQDVLFEEFSTDNLNTSKALLINSNYEHGNSIENQLRIFNISYYKVDDIKSLPGLLNKNNSAYDIVFIFNKYISSNPKKIIQQIDTFSSKAIKNFVLVDENISEKIFLESCLKTRLKSVIGYDINRIQFFRLLHSCIYEIDIESSNNSYEFSTSLNILVGEDNITNQKVIRNILEHENHKVSIVNNGEEVLDTLEKTNFDLLIIDMQMPIMSGIEAVKVFRFSSPDRKNMPIIMLTANATLEAKKQAKEANIDMFLTKPIEPEKLIESIKSIIKNEGQENPSNVINISNEIRILDTNTLVKHFKISKSESFINNLINEYLSDSEYTVNKIKDCLSDKNYLLAVEELHKLAGSSDSVGAFALAAKCREISSTIKSNNFTNKSARYIIELKITFKNTALELRKVNKDKTYSL